MHSTVHPIYTGPAGQNRATRNAHWFRAVAGIEEDKQWCSKHDMWLTRAGTESSNSLGGFLTHDAMDAEIVEIKESQGAARYADVRRIDSAAAIRPRRVNGLTVSFVAEGAVIPESQLEFDALTPSLKKAAILVRASSELLEDSNLGSYLPTEIAYAYAGKEDDLMFNGDGTSTYAGVTGLGARLVGMKSAVVGATGHDTFLEISETDVGSLVANVMGSAISGSAWYISPVGFGQMICRLAATTGGLATQLRPDGTIASASYLGFPVRFSSKLPNVSTTLSGLPMLYFGNLRMAAMLVERGPTVIATSWQRAAEADQILIRATERIDILVHDVGTASAAGPVAMLVGA